MLALLAAMGGKELVVILGAMGGIVYLERLALLMGIDGAMLGFVVATVGGLAGYQLRGWRSRRR